MQNERRNFEKNVKKAGWFIAGFSVLALIISSLLIFADVPAWLNGLIIVILASIFYLIYLFVYGKIEIRKKEKKAKKPKSKDPFAD